MAVTFTDVVDPGPPQMMDGVGQGQHGRGTDPTGATTKVTPLKQKIVTLTFSGTYLTGGYAITVAQMGGLKAKFVDADLVGGFVLVPAYNADGTVQVELWRRAAEDAVLEEVANAAATVAVFRVMVWGNEP